MAKASTQHKLDRVRPPRVQITYDVEIGDAIEVKSLPFELGVLGDFTGMPVEPLARLRDRTFVEVNPDNFDEVLEGMKPHLAFTVENRLAGTDGAPALKVDLHFKTLDDFEPENVARQVKPLRELLELRTKLSDLLGKLQGNDRLEELLNDAITNPAKLKKLESEIHGRDASIAAPPVAAAPAAVAPAAAVAADASGVEPPVAAEIPETVSLESIAAITQPSVAEQAPAPPAEAEHAEPVAQADAPVESLAEAEQTAAAEEVSASGASAEIVEEKAADSVDSSGETAPSIVAAPSSDEVEAGAATESVSEEASAAPAEAEPIDLAQAQDTPSDTSAEEKQVSPVLEATARGGVGADKVEEEAKEEDKESDGSAGVPATKEKAD